MMLTTRCVARWPLQAARFPAGPGIAALLPKRQRIRKYTQAPPPRPPRTAHSSPTSPHHRHEVQEGTVAVNLPFNPPGGPPTPNIPIQPEGPEGGGRHPLADAALTTVVGLGLGGSLRMRRSAQSYPPRSLRRRYRLRLVVQEECPGQGASYSP